MIEIVRGAATTAGIFGLSLGWAALILRPLARLTCWSGRP